MIKSNKSRKEELQLLKERQLMKRKEKAAAVPPGDVVKVNYEAVNLTNAIAIPEFYQSGFYIDRPFVCKDCGSDEVWRAKQQKWWFEVLHARTDTKAVRCKACRSRRRGLIEINNVKTADGLRLKTETKLYNK